MLDIAATLENRKTRLEWVKNVSPVITIPLTVGGGVSTLDDIRLLFDAGADNVSVNSAAVKRPNLVKEAMMSSAMNISLWLLMPAGTALCLQVLNWLWRVAPNLWGWTQ